MAFEVAEGRRNSASDTAADAGTRFGLRARMSRPAARQRDRRVAVGELLAAVVRTLDRGIDVSLMRGAFESALRRVLPLRSVRLREAGNRWGRAGEASGAESVAFEVPGGRSGAAGRARGDLRSGCRLGEWDFQLLGQAAQLGALVLEIERARGAVAARRRRAAQRQPRATARRRSSDRRRRWPRCAATIERVAAHRLHGAARRRERRRQGAGRAADSRAAAAARNGPFVAVNCAALVETLLEAELFGIEERTATGVRGRRGKFEARRRRHALPRRGRRSVAVGAGQAAARDSGPRRRACRRHRRRIASTSASSPPPTAACRELVERRLFRPDLFYRLSGVDIRVPPLRERRDDIVRARAALPRAPSAALRPLRLAPAAADALVALRLARKRARARAA